MDSRRTVLAVVAGLGLHASVAGAKTAAGGTTGGLVGLADAGADHINVGVGERSGAEGEVDDLRLGVGSELGERGIVASRGEGDNDGAVEAGVELGFEAGDGVGGSVLDISGTTTGARSARGGKTVVLGGTVGLGDSEQEDDLGDVGATIGGEVVGAGTNTGARGVTRGTAGGVGGGAAASGATVLNGRFGGSRAKCEVHRGLLVVGEDGHERITLIEVETVLEGVEEGALLGPLGGGHGAGSLHGNTDIKLAAAVAVGGEGEVEGPKRNISGIKALDPELRAVLEGDIAEVAIGGVDGDPVERGVAESGGGVVASARLRASVGGHGRDVDST